MGIGPGGSGLRTLRALEAIGASEVVVGYERYLTHIEELLRGKEVVPSKMTREVERCRLAISLAAQGRKVALVSGGDPGVYGMAGLALEIMGSHGSEIEVEVVAGVSSAHAAAAALGAPLMLDYACMSLSDLLLSWEAIAKRLEAVAQSELVAVIYNPKSKKRDWQVEAMRDIFLKYRPPSTLTAVASDVSLPEESCVITTLNRLCEQKITMRSLIFIGNSTTYRRGRWLITPRGYKV